MQMRFIFIRYYLKKMKYNLKAIEKFSFFEDIKTMFATVAAVIK